MKKNSVLFMTKACLFACAIFAFVSCKDDDEFFSKDDKSNVKEANTFDFSTKNAVDLIVDYSAYETHGPVRFAIYYKNPVVNEGNEGQYIDEDIDPLFVDYTDENGKFDATITLPAYAKVLHIVTSDFTVGLKRMPVEVVNGEAKAVLPAIGNEGTTRAAGKTGPGPATTVFKNVENLSFKISTSTGESTNTRIYKDWKMWLGSWDEYSGRPNYLLDAATASPGLILPNADIESLYKSVKSTLNSCGGEKKSSSLKDQLSEATDLTLIRDAEVSITVLGSQTCWTNTMGYYYYRDDNKPTKPMDLNIIMLFPNTQDGLRYVTDPAHAYNQGNIGVHRGDAVQLIYYPNIASGSKEGATTIFPKGTRIGFILKSHGWGTQSSGTEYCIKDGSGKIMNKKMNIWGTSTNGLSYCGEKYSYTNTEGKAKTAKFDCVVNGNRYAITSYEDACDDVDYDDLIFALTPANAFAEMAQVENGKATTTGVFAFEDLWPSRGDYDMNDVVVNCKNEMYSNTSGTVTKQVFSLTTYQKTVDLVNGLAVRFTGPATSKVVMKKMAPGVTNMSKAVSTTYETYKDAKDGSTIYYLTDRVETDLGSTYILEMTYQSAQQAYDVEDVIEPFIYRKESDGKYLEIHIPFKAPTSRMNTSYFGTEDDRSNLSTGDYYVREGLYPFAFYLSGTKADNFFETLLSSDGEHHPVDDYYPYFRIWSSSKGKNYADWYLRPNM